LAASSFINRYLVAGWDILCPGGVCIRDGFRFDTLRGLYLFFSFVFVLSIETLFPSPLTPVNGGSVRTLAYCIVLCCKCCVVCLLFPHRPITRK
jgi:hypothetical protein